MGPNDFAAAYAVDIAFCIDCTGSMRPYLESAKSTAERFHDLLAEEMASKDKRVGQLRVRIVAYRDLGFDGPDAMEATRFFSLPDEGAAFSAFVRSLEAKGGHDEPESGLEALALAIRSPWDRTADNRRHVIVICTDASAHPLGTHAFTGEQGMPTSLSELDDMWGDSAIPGEMDPRAKRLVVFAPDANPWSDLSERWDHCIMFPSKAAAGLRESEQREILSLIAASV
jgi:hypothetical protein